MSDLLQRLDQITDQLAALREHADDPATLIAIAEMFCKIGECWARVLRAETDADELDAMESQFRA